MKLGILGRKVGTTQIFDENGNLVPVTVIDTTECCVSQVKTKDKEGYNAIQVSYGSRKPQNVKKATAGHFKKAGTTAKQFVREFRLQDTDDCSSFKLGAALSPSMFQKGDRVDVTGTSKGRGYTGVVKRYGFHGGDATHGVSDYFRHGGSNGSNTFPGKVIKLKGMPGHMGAVKTTAIGLQVVDVRENENLILLRGNVPGPREGMLVVRPTSRRPVPTGRTFVRA